MIGDVIIIGVIASLAYLFCAVTSIDRFIEIKLSGMDDLLTRYGDVPRKSDAKRVVALIRCPESVSEDTIKSLLSQSVRLDDIAVETDNPVRKYQHILTYHAPGTSVIREGELDTIIMPIVNGRVYDYDDVENFVKAKLHRLSFKDKHE